MISFTSASFLLCYLQSFIPDHQNLPVTMAYPRLAPQTNFLDPNVPIKPWYDQWTDDDEAEARKATERRQAELLRCECERCSPKKRSKHDKYHLLIMPYLQTRDSHYYQNMEYNRYELISLAQFMVDTFSKPQDEWTNFQRKALEQWHLRSKKLLHRLAFGTKNNSGFQALKECFSIINRLLFLGQLKKVTLQWYPNLYCDGYRAVGTCQYFSENNTLTICIDPDHSQPTSVNIVGTLLHEATHAFLEQYGCTSKYPAKCKCRKLVVQKIGSGGHGPAWRSLTAAVEDFAIKYLGIGSRSSDFLGLINSTRLDVQDGDPHPSLCELSRTFNDLKICPATGKGIRKHEL